MNTVRINLRVNRAYHTLETLPNRTLLDVLRDDLGLTGTKNGCSSGECGACTVLMDGEPVNSCLVLAPQVDGHSIETIEGLCDGDQLHPLQRAFIEQGAVQCGFCTPGMIMTAYALLRETPVPEETQIRQAMSGNLCRCTGYEAIVRAVQVAAKEMANG